MPVQRTYLSYGEMNLINNFRGFWLDLARWGRESLISIASGFGNFEAVTNRLFRVPVNLGDLLRLIFGTEAAESIQNPLLIHIVTMINIFRAQKDGNSQAVNENTVLVYQNADEIARILSQMNPFWNETQWRNLLYNYISLTLEESTAMLSGDYARAVDIYDRISNFTTIIGDYTANGVIQYLTVRSPQVT